jgi:hypothetical protein
MGLDLVSLIGGSLGDTAAKIIGKFKEDPTVKAQLQAALDEHAAEFQLAELQMQIKLQDAMNAQVAAQIGVNQTEAAGGGFKAGWRPLIGYICGAGLAYEELLRPLINFIAQCFHSKAVAQDLDMGTLMTLLLGMLGLGAMRTVEKLKGQD